MRDVAFLVRLPEGATGIQRSRRLLEGLLPEDEIRSQEKQTRKEISSIMQVNLCGEGDSRRRPAGYGGPRKSAAYQGVVRRGKLEGHSSQLPDVDYQSSILDTAKK